jgi:hypothetical protein
MKTQYDNSGIIFNNDRKEKDSHPDRQGSATIAGVEYWISGWIKEGNRGQFITLSFKRKDEKADAQPQSASKDDDDFPF